MPPSTPMLSHADAHALARALVGLPWQHVPASPLTCALLGNLQLDLPADAQFLRRLLQPDLLRQVIAIDPYADWVDNRAEDIRDISILAPSAQLTPAQLSEALGVGSWLSDYVTWAGASANETPLLFLEGAGLYLAAVAVGRRLYLHTPWRQTVYPNLYLMTVAVSTYFRKSAGLGLANEVARSAIPHMLMPQPGSPENFMSLLGGVLPTNFDTLPHADRERLTQGNVYAAQRGILRDELSALFKSMSKDYMSGMKELLMQLYDCPAYLDSTTNNRGMVVIRDSALSILGAATPAELASALTVNDWYNGNLARFALLTPETDYKERPAPTVDAPPQALVNRLRRLHERLPAPAKPAALGDSGHSEAWSLSGSIWPSCHAYEQALRKLTAPSSALDDRLRAVYGRLHVHALKVAILLAALDWADANASGRPVVQPAHWYRAQQITESWRASAHRLLHDLGDNEELRLEVRVLRLLSAHPDGLTARSIYRALKTARKPALDALTALEQDGRIQRVGAHIPGRPGLQPDVYVLMD